MSIIGGVLAGYFAFKSYNKGIKEKHHISFNGKIKVSQNIPGRLRLHTDLLKEVKVSKEITDQLIRVEGIKQVTSNEITGSMLINYDPQIIKGELLIAAMIRLLNIDPEHNGGSEEIGVVTREVRMINKALDYALINKTNGMIDSRTLLSLTFVGLAARQYYKTGNIAGTSPITLLYWAYNSMGLGGNQK